MQDTIDPDDKNIAPPAEGGGRRSRRSQASRPTGIEQPAWRQPRNPFQPVRIVSDDELEAIHLASLQVLEEIGIDVMHPEAKEMLARAGASVDPSSDRVRMDAGLVEQALKTVPSHFRLHARNPAHSVEMGGNWMAYCTVGSAPNVADLDGGRRPGNYKDFCNLVRLAQSLNAVHLMAGYPVEPIDIHPSVRHLDCLSAFAKLSDKPFHAYSLGIERNRDALEIARIARGISQEQFEREPSLFSIINSNSPLKLDHPMVQGILEMSRNNQVVVLTPFTLAGAMAPVTIAGAVTQQNAEALAGLVIAQLARPGAPFMYGGFTSNVDMRSGAPAFGTPEYMKATLLSGQLARRYGIPYRSSNVCAANGLDAQAAYESVFSLWAVTMGGANMVMHAAGWMEGGLQASFEKMVLDADLLQMINAFMEPLAMDQDSLGLDAMREVGPGGHFFGTAHTQSRYRTAFFSPMVSDWRNYQSWAEAGSPDALQKCNRLYKQFLAEYQQPPMPAEIVEELDAFVARRKEEGGAPTDF